MADVPKYAETAVLQQAIPIALLPVQSQKYRQVVTVSVLNMIAGILSIVIGILAMVMDSAYKETNFYWSTNRGIGIYFGALIILTGILGIISHVRRYKNSALIICTVDTPLRAQDGSTIYSACDVPQQSIGMEKSEPPPPYST